MHSKDNIFKLMAITLVVCAFLALSSMPAISNDTSGNGMLGGNSSDFLSGQEGTNRLDWGPDGSTSVPIAPPAFGGLDATHGSYIRHLGGNRYCSSDCTLDANLNLPSGALLTGFELDAYDSDTGSVCLDIYRCPYGVTDCTSLGHICTLGASGFTFVQQSAMSHTVDNYNNTYIFEVVLPAGENYRVVGTRAFYRLQVSPAPAYATFTDVPVGHWAHQYVAALAASGITTGYGDGSFRPGEFVTRGQMAAFLSRALGLYWPN